MDNINENIMDMVRAFPEQTRINDEMRINEASRLIDQAIENHRVEFGREPSNDELVKIVVKVVSGNDGPSGPNNPFFRGAQNDTELAQMKETAAEFIQANPRAFCKTGATKTDEVHERAKLAATNGTVWQQIIDATNNPQIGTGEDVERIKNAEEILLQTFVEILNNQPADASRVYQVTEQAKSAKEIKMRFDVEKEIIECKINGKIVRSIDFSQQDNIKLLNTQEYLDFKQNYTKDDSKQNDPDIKNDETKPTEIEHVNKESKVLFAFILSKFGNHNTDAYKSYEIEITQQRATFAAFIMMMKDAKGKDLSAQQLGYGNLGSI